MAHVVLGALQWGIENRTSPEFLIRNPEISDWTGFSGNVVQFEISGFRIRNSGFVRFQDSPSAFRAGGVVDQGNMAHVVLGALQWGIENRTNPEFLIRNPEISDWTGFSGNMVEFEISGGLEIQDSSDFKILLPRRFDLMSRLPGSPAWVEPSIWRFCRPTCHNSAETLKALLRTLLRGDGSQDRSTDNRIQFRSPDPDGRRRGRPGLRAALP
jgi:hypothetical protein